MIHRGFYSMAGIYNEILNQPYGIWVCPKWGYHIVSTVSLCAQIFEEHVLKNVG